MVVKESGSSGDAIVTEADWNWILGIYEWSWAF